MTKDFLYQYIRQHTLAVVSTISGEKKPESALLGIAITEELEIIFDTVKTSRKYKNLVENPAAAIVIGWDNETTLQYEGTATALNDTGDEKYKEAYFAVFPDGRQRAETWPGLVHFKVSPKWIRYNNFNEPQIIEELHF